MNPADLVRTYLSRDYLRSFLLLLFPYMIGTQLTFLLSASPAIFPIHSGIALAGLLIAGTRVWPAIFIGGLVTYLVNGISLPLALTYTAANVLQATLAAYLLRRFGFDRRLSHMTDIFALLGVALCASLIVPAIVMAQRAIAGASLDVPWSAWWVGHMLSLLIVTPFLVTWTNKLSFQRRGREWAEFAAAFAVLTGTLILSSFLPIETIGGIPVGLFVLVPLFWMALRFDPSATTLGFLIMTILVGIGTALGLSSTSTLPRGQQLLNTQVSMVVVAIIYFTLAAIAAERRTAVRALRAQITKLEDFIAVFAHEVRNPLSPLVSSLELLQIRTTDRETRETVDIMSKHLTTTRRLLDDLLDMSRVSRQKLSINKEVCDLREIVLTSLKMTEEKFKARRQHMLSRVQKEPMRVFADPVRLQQVFTNLLNNASKFTPQGGTVVLTAMLRGADAEVRISDNGMGIDQDMLETIFEPFTQLENRVANEKGLGIGLALAREIVQQHDGVIRARSDGEGKGSEFTVVLPAS